MQSSILKTLAVVALTTLSMSAFAEGAAHCTKEPASKWMAKKDVSATLVAQGMQVKRIKTEGSCYEAYAIGKDGKKSQLMINPVSGAPVGNEANGG